MSMQALNSLIWRNKFITLSARSTFEMNMVTRFSVYGIQVSWCTAELERRDDSAGYDMAEVPGAEMWTTYVLGLAED